ncbi:pheromone A receptor-domain-containing protein [Russula compacta]|nr:pheromone A receptor-domain-containing protein [Russula compacta]
MAYPNELYSAFSFIGFVICAIPLYWHLEAENVGTSLYLAWAGLACLNAFINSVVWNNTIENLAPVWCDISTRFAVGFTVGAPLAVLVISRRLYKIASKTTTLSATRAEKLRAMFVDLAIGLGLPFLQMILQIVVEGRRFSIYERIGCQLVVFNTALAYPLSFLWPPVISFIVLVYSCLNIYLFWKSSRQLNEMLGSNKNPNQSRYTRLIALSIAQSVCTLGISLCFIYIQTYHMPLFPWGSWEAAHLDYSVIDQFSADQWLDIPVTAIRLELQRWIFVFSAFIFFAFFGFAEEAQRHYRMVISYASTQLHLPDFVTSRGSRGSSNKTSSSTSSFGTSLRKGMATLVSFKDSFSSLGSHSGRPDSIMEHKISSLVPGNRLTSDGSIFEDVIDEQHKSVYFLPDEHSSRFTPTPQTLPHRPTLSHHDPSQNV